MFKLALDAGHYRHTVGKRCLADLDPAQTREWVLNDRIARLVEQGLERYDCTVLRVDDTTGETEVTLASRAKAANVWGADLYLAIHHNAGVNGGAGGGIVVYTAPNASAQAKKVQQAIYERTVACTGLRGNRSNPVASAQLYVLTHTDMPAVLGEFGFMDSTTDVPIILTDAFAAQTARGIVEALVQCCGLKERENKMTQQQFEQMMIRWLKGQEEKPASNWSRMTEAAAAGLTDGSRPGAFATREEVATMLMAALALVEQRKADRP